jgi:DNA polymerase
MSRRELFIDIEAYSGTDLKKSGAYRYVEDPDFRILMIGYAFGDDPVELVDGVDVDIWLAETTELLNGDIVKIAHNAAFERVCFSRALGLPTGRYLDPLQWHDTMAIAAERAYPQKLERLAPALGAEDKDSAGTRLINIFCTPNKAGVRTLPAEKPEDWEAFKAYCIQDVSTLRDVHHKLGGWPTPMERSIFYADQLINDRGLRIDVPMARAAYSASRLNHLEQKEEFTELSGVENPASVPQVQAWVAEQGLSKLLPTLRAEHVEKALRKDLQPAQRRVLELRQELALAAPGKFRSALESVGGDGRLRGTFRFHGAHTGRWAGRGVQPHNLPRLGFKNVVRRDYGDRGTQGRRTPFVRRAQAPRPSAVRSRRDGR